MCIQAEKMSLNTQLQTRNNIARNKKTTFLRQADVYTLSTVQMIQEILETTKHSSTK